MRSPTIWPMAMTSPAELSRPISTLDLLPGPNDGGDWDRSIPLSSSLSINGGGGSGGAPISFDGSAMRVSREPVAKSFRIEKRRYVVELFAAEACGGAHLGDTFPRVFHPITIGYLFSHELSEQLQHGGLQAFLVRRPATHLLGLQHHVGSDGDEAGLLCGPECLL